MTDKSATPATGSRWQHRNGNQYQVLVTANTDSDDLEKFPPTVVYWGKDGKVWSRRLSDWENSFKPLLPEHSRETLDHAPLAANTLSKEQIDSLLYKHGYDPDDEHMAEMLQAAVRLKSTPHAG